MDPDRNLEEMISLSEDMIKEYENEEGNGIDQDDAYRLAELVQAMNNWIVVKGDYIPSQWSNKMYDGDEEDDDEEDGSKV